MSIEISAVVATYNRAAYVRQALQSLIEQSLPRDQYEVIIVDNGSHDETRQVVDAFVGCGNVRYCREPVTGVSRARNTGWRNAHGPYIAFMDDDAVATPQWLSILLDVLKQTEPRPGMAGGRIEGLWETPRPDWLSDDLLGALSIYHWSEAPRTLTRTELLSSCNLGVPRELLERAGGFREDLDRQGNLMRANGEVYLRDQLESWGLRAFYHPEAKVYHHVPVARVAKKHYRTWAYWQGMSDVLTMDPQGCLPGRLRAWLTLRRVAWALPRSLLAIASPHPAARFRRQCQAIEAAGYLAGLWRPRQS